MRQLCEDSKEAGIRTLVALDEQGEQLDRVEEDMDKINTDMKEAEKALTGMEQCCGLCTCPCNKSKEFQEDESTWKGNDDGKVIGGQPVRTVDDRGGGMMMTGNYIAKVTKDAREDEMEENMQEVNTMIGNLRNMAIDMGSEISAQNSQIGRINQKVRSSNFSINYPCNPLMHELILMENNHCNLVVVVNPCLLFFSFFLLFFNHLKRTENDQNIHPSIHPHLYPVNPLVLSRENKTKTHLARFSLSLSKLLCFSLFSRKLFGQLLPCSPCLVCVYCVWLCVCVCLTSFSIPIPPLYKLTLSY